MVNPFTLKDLPKDDSYWLSIREPSSKHWVGKKKSGEKFAKVGRNNETKKRKG